MYNLIFPGLSFDFNNLITLSSIGYILWEIWREKY